MNIDIQQIQHIVNLVSQSPIQGVSISDGQQSLQVNKWVTPQPSGNPYLPSTNQSASQSATQNAIDRTKKSHNHRLTNEPNNGLGAKKSIEKSTEPNSPMAGGLGGQIASTRDVDTGRIIATTQVGYLRLRADDVTPILVNVGDTVSKGQTLAYVQSTVKMLPVTANVSGQIVDILVDDGDKIEYGQALFALARD